MDTITIKTVDEANNVVSEEVQEVFFIKDGESWDDFMDRLEQEEMTNFWGRG